jgi:ceramide glucosyltransferase
VAHPRDPAVAVVERLRREFPEREIVLSIGRAAAGANGKVASLVRMMRRARHQVLVLSDADIRVGRDYLRALVAPLADPEVGLTTCLYRGRGLLGLPSVVEELFINTDFMPMVLVSRWVEDPRHAFGASIAMRREALEAIGGFASIADYLADDNLLGHRIADAGYRVELLPYTVDTILDAATLADAWRHQVRWARTYRVQQPIGWFASFFVVHTVTWGLAAVLLTAGTAPGWAALAAALGCRLGTLLPVQRRLGNRARWRHLWLVPFKDLGYSAVWLASWLGRTVVWSSDVFRVEQDGRMTPVELIEVPLGSEVPVVDEIHTRGGERISDARAQ